MMGLGGVANRVSSQAPRHHVSCVRFLSFVIALFGDSDKKGDDHQEQSIQPESVHENTPYTGESQQD